MLRWCSTWNFAVPDLKIPAHPNKHLTTPLQAGQTACEFQTLRPCIKFIIRRSKAQAGTFWQWLIFNLYEILLKYCHGMRCWLPAEMTIFLRTQVAWGFRGKTGALTFTFKACDLNVLVSLITYLWNALGDELSYLEVSSALLWRRVSVSLRISFQIGRVLRRGSWENILRWLWSCCYFTSTTYQVLPNMCPHVPRKDSIAQ